MSLLTSLATASRALQAFSTALGVDQTNVSNVSTPGFAALRAAVRPIDPAHPGLDNSDVVDFESTGSRQADAIVQQASSQDGYSRATSDHLEGINQVFDITGNTGILESLQQFGSVFSALAVSPNDSTLRSNAVAVAGNVATEFRKAAASLDIRKAAVDTGIADAVSNINGLAGQIRDLNVAVRGQTQANPATDASLRVALEKLSALTDINVLPNADGTISVLTGGRQPLVLGDQAYTLHTDLSAAAGSQITSSGGGSSPASYSGELGALLNLKNGALRDLAGDSSVPGSLNQLAAGFASRVNGLLASGTRPSGGPGVAIFAFDSSSGSNSARTLGVVAGFTGDSLALEGTGVTGGANSVATQLAALTASTQTADQIGGLAPQSFFGRFAATIGQQLSDARAAAASDATSLVSAQANRQQVSGVSLDQEAVNITAYQRSYQASARIVSILDQLTSDTVNLIK